MIMQIRIIAAKIFDERARDGIAKQVGRKNLAVEFLAPEQPCEEKIQSKIQQAIVNLRRMNRHAGGRMVGWKTDSPRQIGWAAITTTV